MPEFSICIPTYEYKGRGVEFLSHLFDTLEEQTFTDYEVIVSDHSQDLEIYNFCEKSGDRFDLKYLRNSEQRGSLSQNTNMCFRIAQGRILKPVYQDDFFYDASALMKIKDVFDTTSCKWVVTACNHYDDKSKTFYRDFYPNFNNPSSTLFGENLLSCPTVISFLKSTMIEFDENLKMLMDCEFYYRMYIENGMPFLLNQILMTNRSHSGQSQHQEDFQNVMQTEQEYCYHKHVAQNNYLGS